MMLLDSTLLDSDLSSRLEYYTTYSVNGFRSLNGFKIRLEEGLNVLVGPNGAGKTNFIEFLDFLSVYLVRGAAGAISQSGGISRVFSQETLRSKRPRITAKICGLADLNNHLLEEDTRCLFRYEYEIDIRYSKLHSAVYVASEKLKFKSLFWPDLAVLTQSTVGTVSLKRRTPIEDSPIKWDVGKRLLSKGGKNPLQHQNVLRSLKTRAREDSHPLLDIPTVSPDQSFLQIKSAWPAMDAVRTSLSRGRAFNLIPGLARASDDMSRPPGIAPDGSGLSATLYHMVRARSGNTTPAIRARRLRPDSISRIVAWTRLVLPELKDIYSNADPHTGRYLSGLVVGVGDQDLRVPLSNASDGTIKWLSFVCLVILQANSYSLEEPENFLHPKMQRMLVKLIRESLEDDHPGYFILSTHSESVINQCEPPELVLFNFRRGKTSCKRLDHPEAVAGQINETGFGLGYYYASNAVS